MSPHQFKAIFTVHTRPHSPLRQWHVYGLLYIAFLVAPLTLLYSTGIWGVLVEIVLASLLIRRYLQPYFQEDYRIIREGLQRLAGLGIVLSLLILTVYGLADSGRLLGVINQGAAASEAFTPADLRGFLIAALLLLGVCLGWIVIGGYFKLKKMLAQHSTKGMKHEALFQ